MYTHMYKAGKEDEGNQHTLNEEEADVNLKEQLSKLWLPFLGIRSSFPVTSPPWGCPGSYVCRNLGRDGSERSLVWWSGSLTSNLFQPLLVGEILAECLIPLTRSRVPYVAPTCVFPPLIGEVDSKSFTQHLPRISTAAASASCYFREDWTQERSG